jgi:uncharacterized protein with PIN domain
MLLILYYRPEGLIKEKPVMTTPIKKVLKEHTVKKVTDASRVKGDEYRTCEKCEKIYEN